MVEAAFFDFPDPFIWWQVACVAVAFFLASFIIGLFGVAGGVVYVPALLMLPGMKAVTAVSTVFVAGCPMSLCRLAQLQYYRRIKWSSAGACMVGAGITAFPAQLAVNYIPKAIIITIVCLVALYAGFQAIYFERKKQRLAALKAAAPPAPAKDAPLAEELPGVAVGSSDMENAPPAEAPIGIAVEPSDDQNAPPAEEMPGIAVGSTDKENDVPIGEAIKASPALPAIELNVAGSEPAAVNTAPVPDVPVPLIRSLLIGAVAGFISSVGGLGGPVVLMPLFFVFMPPMEMKVLIGVTSPTAGIIVTVSMVGGIIFGEPDYGLALVVGPVSVFGSLLGGYLQERVASNTLKQVVAWLLIALGTMMLTRTAIQEFGAD